MINLNNVGTQKDRPLIPDGPYCLKARVVPGGAGPGGMLRRAQKNRRKLMLELECSVVGGEHEGYKIWDYLTVELDESTNGDLPPIKPDELKDLQISLRLGLVRLRAIVDSALGLDPDDRSAEMEKKRSFESYDFFNGLKFRAQFGWQPGSGKYGPSNKIDFIIVPGDPAYKEEESRAVVPHKRWGDDLDDECPY